MRKTVMKAENNPLLPDVWLEIGGRERQLSYDMAAIAKAEQLTGVNLLRAATFQNLTFSEVRGLLYAALLRDEPGLTLEEMDGWHILHNFVIICGAIAQAWYGSVPKADDVPAGEETAQE